MKKEQLIELAKKSSTGEPISQYNDLQWSATSNFLSRFAYELSKPIRDEVHNIVLGILKQYGVSDGERGWINHSGQDGKFFNDPLSLEGELLFGIEAIVEMAKAKERESAQANERERCAKVLEISQAQMLLMAGEMTAQEKRTAKAILAGLAAQIRGGD